MLDGRMAREPNPNLEPNPTLEPDPNLDLPNPNLYTSRFQVCAQMDGRISNVKPAAPSRATSGDAHFQPPKA